MRSNYALLPHSPTTSNEGNLATRRRRILPFLAALSTAIVAAILVLHFVSPGAIHGMNVWDSAEQHRETGMLSSVNTEELPAVAPEDAYEELDPSFGKDESPPPVLSSAVLQVRPLLHPPPDSATRPKYLAFESHSGFHNQRISLTNALTLAHILNRTLLLPPARLGKAEPWGTDLQTRTIIDEECKAALRQPGKDECQSADRWTYVGWSFLLRHKLFEDKNLVDRWNSSDAWFSAPREEGGLGVDRASVHRFPDPDRRSVKLFDLRETVASMTGWTKRIDLEDLMEGEMAEIDVLHFGSLFSSGRLALRKAENKAFRKMVEGAMMIGNKDVDRVTEAIKARIGDYIGVHLRVGDGVFKIHAVTNMKLVFGQVAASLGLKPSETQALLDGLSDERKPPRRLLGRRSPNRIDLKRRTPSMIDCPRPLSGDQRLNQRMYIATDSRNPRDDPHLAPFFQTFPCVFVLNDFDDLLKETKDGWRSDFDGSSLAGFLLPFLEAEVAAKGRLTFGTPGSTFSAYTAGLLHSTFANDHKMASTGRKKKKPSHSS